jgi:antitoxin component YwqK of YwqJK toxin-antitoxin module
MKLNLFTFIILLIIKSAYGQSLPNTFKAGNYVEILPNDSIKIWYNCVGAISNSKCASFYRIGKIDPDRIALTGKFADYDTRGRLIYKAQMINGNLEGRAYYFYPSGKVRETGVYVHDERKGTWSYYYENGQLEKTLNFNIGTPDIIEFYTKKGKALVTEGNGIYEGVFNAEAECSSDFRVSGAVKSGKMDGVWKFSSSFTGLLSTEVYENGVFIKGVDAGNYGGKEYKANKPAAIKISGFYGNERNMMDENSIGCPGDRTISFKNNGTGLVSGFYPQLIKQVKTYKNLKQQCLFICIDFNDDKIKQVNVYSSKNDEELERWIYNYISNITGWTQAHATSDSSPPLFFAINIDPSLGNENVLIPIEYKIRTMSLFGGK